MQVFAACPSCPPCNCTPPINCAPCPSTSCNQQIQKACSQCQSSVEAPYLVEHLPTYKGSSVNMVKVYSNGVIVNANNVLKVTFSSNFNSKKVCPNQQFSFVLNEGLTTKEGRRLLPCGSQILARVQQVDSPKWANRSAKVHLIFDEIVLPNCKRIPLCAKVYSKDCALRVSKWKSFSKAAGWTLGSFGVGSGLGAAIGTVGKASIGCMTYGMPIGGGVGLLLGSLTPGLHYKAKEGSAIYIQLVQNLSICCESP